MHISLGPCNPSLHLSYNFIQALTLKFIVACRSALNDDSILQVLFCDGELEKMPALSLYRSRDGLSPDQGLHVGQVEAGNVGDALAQVLGRGHDFLSDFCGHGNAGLGHQGPKEPAKRPQVLHVD